MSAINLSGNASGSGTFTIASPNSNTSYTLSLPEEAGTITTSNSPYSTFRNRIINGDMRIDQRNAGASFTPTNGYGLDRFQYILSQASKITSQQSTTAPAGFTNSLLVTSSAATSVGADDYYMVSQPIEGFNVADLGWGTASAKTITISFWVRSSLTGTFGGSVINKYDTGGRYYQFTYTISAADTWEQKTVTIAGDTSGTWLTNNGRGLYLSFSLGVGATYSATAGSWGTSYAFSPTGATQVVATNGATFYITGVQLEVGSVATPFERRPYGTELALCQRYYQQRGGNSGDERIAVGWCPTTTQGRFIYPTRVVMRASPTLSISSVSDFAIEKTGPSSTAVTAMILDQPSPEIIGINATVASGLTAGQGVQLQASNTDARIRFSAEL